MNTHREQQWQLQLMQQRANVDQLSQQVNDLHRELAEALDQRDRARRVAMALEEENHQLAADQVCAVCSSAVVVVDTRGVAT